MDGTPATPEDEEIGVDELCSYALDVWVEDVAVLTDEARLLAVLREAVVVGEAHVLGEAAHVFPNGAVTAILLLSASHLSLHTWPEYALANVDLLAYGRIKGERMTAHVAAGLGASRTNLTRVLRAVR